MRYHFIKDHVERGTIELYFVKTEYQLADLFTKPLDEKRFIFLISKLGMGNVPSPCLFRGGTLSAPADLSGEQTGAATGDRTGEIEPDWTVVLINLHPTEFNQNHPSNPCPQSKPNQSLDDRTYNDRICCRRRRPGRNLAGDRTGSFAKDRISSKPQTPNTHLVTIWIGSVTPTLRPDVFPATGPEKTSGDRTTCNLSNGTDVKAGSDETGSDGTQIGPALLTGDRSTLDKKPPPNLCVWTGVVVFLVTEPPS
ncbi:hypothetical protein OSB04_002188 [Centaurea solstitialis]|uniref:Uncharacterized protein n=1 Tax=Centaurea solstitialis TaxID=347529 RepID=A0AA38WM46_9ASTR|nr:hypothetical protein OSB04_002188 [Centaurea solstitialis]